MARATLSASPNGESLWSGKGARAGSGSGFTSDELQATFPCRSELNDLWAKMMGGWLHPGDSSLAQLPLPTLLAPYGCVAPSCCRIAEDPIICP